MIIKAKRESIEAALYAVNRYIFEGNIKFRRFDPVGNRWRVTLTVVDSAGPGGRRSVFHRRRIAAACWHVHGAFFDALFKNEPEAVIRARERKITKDEGNWMDWNAGSRMCPVPASTTCECLGRV